MRPPGISGTWCDALGSQALGAKPTLTGPARCRTRATAAVPKTSNILSMGHLKSAAGHVTETVDS